MNRKRILIVEDDSSIREMLRAVLKHEKFDVAEAEDGEMGMDYLMHSNNLPNLILLDIRMPVKDGFAFRRAQLRVPHLAKIPVVVMTSDGGIEEKSERMGATGRLQKPLDLKKVFSVIDPIFEAAHH